MACGRTTPKSASEALDVALVACHRGLEGLRRVRRMLEAGVERAQDSEPLPEEIARLRALAATSGATLTIAEDMPEAPDLAAGLLLTFFRIVEALLRFSAAHEATVDVGCDGTCLRLRLECGRTPREWLRPHPELERVRERIRWFDGRLLVEATDRGSAARVELPTL